MNTESGPDRSLFTIERFQDYEGEERANLLRVIGVAAFYSIHYLHYHKVRIGVLQFDDVEISRRFHLTVSLIGAAWTLMALSVLVCLKGFRLPTWVKFATTGGDLVLLTSVLCAGNGAKSPIVVGYFLILIIAALRFNLVLIRAATVTALFGYLTVLACARWPNLIGRDSLDTVPRYEQLVILVAIGLTGIMLGQIIRRTRRIVFALTEQAQNKASLPAHDQEQEGEAG